MIKAEKTLHYIWLTLCGGVGTARTSKVFGHFKNDATAVYKAKLSNYLDVDGLSEKDAQLFCNKDLSEAKRIAELCRNKGIDIIAFEDERYPQRLKTIKPLCPVLYVKGVIPKGIDGFSIAVVGTRRPTEYGFFCAKYIAQELADNGIIVVSGMAEGIDGAAQRQVLDNQGQTVAVLGSSADYPYPYINRDIYNRISKSGAIISEYPPITKPFRQNFPVRNRIISGLCAGTVVIEAGERSGALITAHWALEPGKDILAVPGEITSAQSAGTNLLIKDGAIMVTKAQDIIDYYDGIYSINKKEIKKEKTSELEVSSEAQRVLSFLSKTPIHISELSERSQISIAELSVSIIELEIADKIICQAGGFIRLGYDEFTK